MVCGGWSMDNPLHSPDPTIRSLAQRLESLRAEVQGPSLVLAAYAAVHGEKTPVAMAAPLEPLAHRGISDRTACGCLVCIDWRQRAWELSEAMRFVPEGHRWSICACADCRFAGRMHLNYIAAANVRDLLIGVAFHASYHSRHGKRIMDWFAVELAQPKYTVDWCAYELGRRPLDEWLDRCEMELAPLVSGTIFAVGEGRRDAVSAWFPSQLGDADAWAPAEAA